MGRPSDYGPEVAEAICDRLAAGETLRAICRDEAMPAQSMVFRWLREHTEFREQYARAREAQADAWADQIVEISDDSTGDYTDARAVRLAGVHPPTEEARAPRFDAEHVQRARLRVDTRKWLMARAAPKKYGERVAHEHSGPGGAPIQTITTAMTPKEAADAYAATLNDSGE